MNGGIYHAAAAMDLLGKMQETRAQNLANAGTVGYRKRITAAEAFASALRKAAGVTLPKAKEAIDFSQGLLEQTGGELDLAIEGKGFFAVESADGVRFTRNGSFQLDAQGFLVAADGARAAGENGPLQVDPARGPVEIDRSGRVFQDGETLGRLRIVEFEHVERLIPDDRGRFREGPAAVPRDAVDSTVQQGFLERSNANPIDEMVQMIAGMRAFEAAQRALLGIDRIRTQAVSPSR